MTVTETDNIQAPPLQGRGSETCGLRPLVAAGWALRALRDAASPHPQPLP
jgi:hypothetical protein